MNKLPPGWEETTVGSIAESLVDGPFGSNLKTEHYQSSGVRVIRLQNIADGRFDDTDKAYIAPTHARALNRHEALPGDVLIAALGDVLPRVCLVPPDIDSAVVKADCFRLRPHKGISPRYLAYILSAPQVRKRASIEIAGIGRPRLNLRKVSSLAIPIPPSAEQERIVEVIEEQFSRLDAGTAALGRAQENLKRMRTGVLDAAVNGALMDGSDGKWEKVALGDLLDGIHAGKSFKCAERPSNPDEWGVVKVSAMTWGEFQEDQNKTVMGNHAVDPRFEISPGDLLVSRANTVEYVGAAVLVRKCRPRLLLSDKSLRLVPNSRVLPEWLLISLRTASARKYIESVATGTSDSMRNISQPKLKALNIILPPIEVQARLVTEVDQMMSQVEQLEKSLGDTRRAVHALRSSILAAAFSGRLSAQDPADEPASALLQRIASERTSSNGNRPISGRKPRALPEEVIA
jgi:type I restriction enzyme S subunit